MSRSLNDLQAWKDTYKHETVLLGDIERHVIREALEKHDRDTDALHPSELSKSFWCRREAYYKLTGVSAEPEDPKFQLERIYAEGHAIHDKWQNWLGDMKVLFGRWKCRECHHEWIGTGYVCTECGTPKPRYREYPLALPDLLLKGSTDGVTERGLVEIKSIGIGTLRFEAPALHKSYTKGEKTLEEIWREIHRPFPTHVRQGMLYLHMIRNMEHPDHPWLGDLDQMIFIYEFKPNQGTKEFVVKYRPDLIADLLDDIKDVALGVKHGTTPERPYEDREQTPCKKCGYNEHCWGPSDDSAPPKVIVRRASGSKRRAALGR